MRPGRTCPKNEPSQCSLGGTFLQSGVDVFEVITERWCVKRVKQGQMNIYIYIIINRTPAKYRSALKRGREKERGREERARKTAKEGRQVTNKEPSEQQSEGGRGGVSGGAGGGESQRA